MLDTFSLSWLRATLRFPFQSPEWANRFLVGTALLLAGMIIPFLPTTVVYGYFVRVMRLAINGESLALPAWDNWGELFSDGLRSLGIGLIYLGPGLVTMFGGFFIYMAT